MIEEASVANSAAIAVSVAMAVGMIAQSLARHLRLPGIVLLLAAGVLLGPDLLALIDPQDLGSALPILVNFAVAIILFEGGMNLNLKRLGREARIIRQLLTVGVVVTAAGAAVSARLLMQWDWQMSILFGTLVIVTGPTVITPLLRRIKVQRKLETVLEAEGVLIDPIGAVIAVVALQIVTSLAHEPGSFQSGLLYGVQNLGVGLICGLAGGLAIGWLLRFEHVVPEGLENVFTLSLVLALFQLTSFLYAESGIVAVTVAGVAVGNLETRVHRDLIEFKEQLTVLMIGMLFVLLAAGVSVEQVTLLGWPGIATVLALMLVVRPLNIAISTMGSGLNLRQKVFLAWLAPRGIVAAAVASYFAQQLNAQGIADGDQLQALVFMVIAMTVLIQGLSGGLVSRALGLQRPTNRGYAILGANELGHALGRLLRDSGEDVLFMDSNPAFCHTVEQDGFRVVFGNVLEERTLLRARLEDRAACIAVTTNEEANLLFIHRAIDLFRVPRTYVALARGSSGVNESVVSQTGSAVLFSRPRDLELWALRLRRGLAPIEIWRYEAAPDSEHLEQQRDLGLRTPENQILPLVVWRGDRVLPANGIDGVQRFDVVQLAVFEERATKAHEWLSQHGWTMVESPLDSASGEAAAQPAEVDPTDEVPNPAS